MFAHCYQCVASEFKLIVIAMDADTFYIPLNGLSTSAFVR